MRSTPRTRTDAPRICRRDWTRCSSAEPESEQRCHVDSGDVPARDCRRIISRCRALGPGPSTALRLDPGSQPLFLRTQLRREFFAEVFGFEDRTDFELGAAAERRAFEPVDRLVHRLHLPDPEP